MREQLLLTSSFILENEEETHRFGEWLGRQARAGDVWNLMGPLGGGKTAWVKGFAKGLDFSGPVTSPTFTLQHIYEGRFNLYHFDWYRLEDAREVEDLGWWDWLQRGGVVAVEWGDKFPKLFPPTALRLIFEFFSEEKRRVIVEAKDPGSISRVEELIRCWPP